MSIYKGQFPINFTGGALRGGLNVNQIYVGGNIVYGEPSLPVFTPASIAKYWWVANAGVSEVTEGGTTRVNSWTDQVGSLTITQGTHANRPQLTTAAALNNQSVISFDGVNDNLSRTPISFAADGYAFSVIIIAGSNNTSNGSIVAQAQASAAANRFAFLQENPGDQLYFLAPNFTPGIANTIQNPVTTGVKVGVFEYNATGGGRTFFNNLTTPVATYTGGGTNIDIIQTSALYYGAYNAASGTGTFAGYFYNGVIAEVIWVARTLTAGDLTNLQTYINTRYGLSV